MRYLISVILFTLPFYSFAIDLNKSLSSFPKECLIDGKIEKECVCKVLCANDDGGALCECDKHPFP